MSRRVALIAVLATGCTVIIGDPRFDPDGGTLGGDGTHPSDAASGDAAIDAAMPDLAAPDATALRDGTVAQDAGVVTTQDGMVVGTIDFAVARDLSSVDIVTMPLDLRPPDLTAPPDGRVPPDLAVLPDFAVPPDLAIQPDFAIQSDFAMSPDFAMPPDLRAQDSALVPQDFSNTTSSVTCMNASSIQVSSSQVNLTGIVDVASIGPNTFAVLWADSGGDLALAVIDATTGNPVIRTQASFRNLMPSTGGPPPCNNNCFSARVATSSGNDPIVLAYYQTDNMGGVHFFTWSVDRGLASNSGKALATAMCSATSRPTIGVTSWMGNFGSILSCPGDNGEFDFYGPLSATSTQVKAASTGNNDEVRLATDIMASKSYEIALSGMVLLSGPYSLSGASTTLGTLYSGATVTGLGFALKPNTTSILVAGVGGNGSISVAYGSVGTSGLLVDTGIVADTVDHQHPVGVAASSLNFLVGYTSAGANVVPLSATGQKLGSALGLSGMSGAPPQIAYDPASNAFGVAYSDMSASAGFNPKFALVKCQ